MTPSVSLSQTGPCVTVIQDCEPPDIATAEGKCSLGQVTQKEYCKEHPNTLDQFVEGDPKDCVDISNPGCNYCGGALTKEMTCYSDCICTPPCDRSKGFGEVVPATDTSDRVCKKCKYPRVRVRVRVRVCVCAAVAVFFFVVVRV